MGSAIATRWACACGCGLNEERSRAWMRPRWPTPMRARRRGFMASFFEGLDVQRLIDRRNGENPHPNPLPKGEGTVFLPVVASARGCVCAYSGAHSCGDSPAVAAAAVAAVVLVLEEVEQVDGFGNEHVV